MEKNGFDKEVYVANKCSIASAFSALELVSELPNEELENIRYCLSGFNMMIEHKKKESEEPDSIGMRIACIVKMWMMCHEPNNAIEVLRGLEETTECEDTKELLRDLATMIKNFNIIFSGE